MAQAPECSEDELPDLNALLKQPVREQAERKASKSMKGDLTSGKRRVRRLESKTPIASSRLLRQWDPDRDGIVFGPRVSPPTSAKSQDLPPSEQFNYGKGIADDEAKPRGFRTSRTTTCRPSKPNSSSQKEGRLTTNRPQTSKASADKSSTSHAAILTESEGESSLMNEGAKTAPTKPQSTIEVDAETTDEDSSDESPTTNDDSSEYQNSDQSDSLSETSYSQLPKLPSSRMIRIPRQSSPKRSGIAVDCRNPPSPGPHRHSREDRPRKPATRAKGAEPRRTAQRSPPSEQHKLLHGSQSDRYHASHETLDLAHGLSNLRLPFDESSDSDEYHTPEETKNVKGPCLTPNRRTKSTGLSSPRKQSRIPATPHKPNADIFWSQEFVDEWNDQHSRREPSHAEIPAKAQVKTGQKKETKKSFAARKDQIAQDFLSQLDNRITDGKLTEMAAATGGIKIVWSKTLNTTAGRANWRRETIRTTSAGTHPQAATQFKHHASVELAEKVIDGEDRLLNVLAHEFCHLANFMINGITTNPHGKEFKAWAAKCSREFASQGINVTTKHTYEIDFKYIWTCDACKAQYKRHSKSIDPSRHRCGSCKGLLTQTKPVPRGAGAAGNKPSEYQTFMKEHMKIVRSENPGSPQKEVMRVVAEQWSQRMRARKDEATKAKEVVTQFVDLSLEDGHGLGSS